MIQEFRKVPMGATIRGTKYMFYLSNSSFSALTSQFKLVPLIEEPHLEYSIGNNPSDSK